MIQKISLALVFACTGDLVFVSEEVPVQTIESLTTLPSSTNEVTRMYFIPNGESDYSAKDANGTKFTSGRSPNISLNERGFEQANRLGEALSSKIQNGVVYTPPAKRAEQTASLIASEEIAIGGTYEGLFEVGMGIWEGKPKDQAYKDEYQKWKDLPAHEKYVTPKVGTGESYYDASLRAMRDLAEIVDREEGKTVFIVSGENVLNALAMRWTHPEFSQEAGSDLPMLPMEKCDLFMIEIPKGQPIENATLKLIIHSAL